MQYATTPGAAATQAAINAQVDCFLYDGLSMRLADSVYLRQWLELLRLSKGDVASRKQVAALGAGRVEQVRKRVIAALQPSPGVTVGIDGWTNVRHEKVINLCPVVGGIAFYWDSVVMKRQSTAAAQLQPVLKALRSIIARGIAVVAIVTDNEVVNTALHRLLVVYLPFLIHIPCAAHTIQLCANKAMKLQAVAPIVEALLALLRAFKVNKALRINVREVQRGQNSTSSFHRPLKIVNVVVTRWNSVLRAADRLLRLELAVKACIPQVLKVLESTDYAHVTFDDGSFWRPLRSLTDFLRPYQVATDIVQSDTACLSDVHRQFVSLIQLADSLAIPHPLVGMQRDLIDIIRDQWDNHVNIDAVIACALFSFDASYSSFTNEQKGRSQRWFFDWATEFLSYYHLSDTDDRRVIRSNLLLQHGAFQAGAGVFVDMEPYRKDLPPGGSRRATFAWWLFIDSAAELTRCVLALLSITASEAAVERSFSRQGMVHSKLRNRLDDESVSQHMFFSFNSRALDKQRAMEDPGWEELQDDNESEADDSSTSTWGTELLTQQRGLLVALSEEEEAEYEAEHKYDAEDDDKEEKSADADEHYQQLQQQRQQQQQLQPSHQDRINVFVLDYVGRNGILKGYRWNGAREGTLQAAIIDAGLTEMVEPMKARIKQHVGEMSVAAAAAAP
jgi:hypothetical protein